MEKTFILKKYKHGEKFSINLFEVIPIHHGIIKLTIIAHGIVQQVYSTTIFNFQY